MGANRNLGPMFHGTTADLNVGDKILPANMLKSDNHLRDYNKMPEGTEDHGSKAWATNNLRSAKVFGEFGTHKTGKPNHIYEVEAHDATPDGPAGSSRISSTSGFKIIRKLKPEEHPDLNARHGE